jgi:GntR family transcriptional regulator/MocR family aminotransferase
VIVPPGRVGAMPFHLSLGRFGGHPGAGSGKRAVGDVDGDEPRAWTGSHQVDGGSGPLTTAPGLDISDVMRGIPARVDLTPGVPDLAAFPRTALLRAERTVLNDLSASAFG